MDLLLLLSIIRMRTEGRERLTAEAVKCNLNENDRSSDDHHQHNACGRGQMIFVCGKSWKSEIPFLLSSVSGLAAFIMHFFIFSVFFWARTKNTRRSGWAVLIRSDTETETKTEQGSQSVSQVGRSCVQREREGETPRREAQNK